jgi:hypothetical protein
MVPVTEEKRKIKMAKAKASSGKSAGKQKIQGGPSGKMQKFSPVKPQKPGQSAQQSSGGGGGYAKK